MSQHLWLYEGITEYASQHVQIKYGWTDLEDFLAEMKSTMNQEIFASGTDEMNDLGKSLDLKVGDVILVWNGKKITLQTFSETIPAYYDEVGEGDKASVLVRIEVKGKTKEVKLKAKAMLVESPQKHFVEAIDSPSPKQQQVKAI